MSILDQSDALGGVDDDVVLTVAGKTIAFAESYEVHRSVFSQPSAFSIRTGSGETAKTLSTMFQAGQQFQLKIGGNLNQTGLLEDIEIEETTGASEVTFRGRDWMALLQEGMVEAEKTFANATYLDLVKYALESAGLRNNHLLVLSNLANRKLQTGIPIQELQHFSVEQLRDGVLGQSGAGGVNVGVFQQQIKTHIGESLHAFVRRYLDRAGLVFFCSADGRFVVTVINVHQTPAMQIVRTGLNDTRATVNVEHASFRNHTAHRHSEVRVYGSGGGRKGGHAKMKASFEDAEIKDLYGLHKVMVIHDNHIKNDAQALYLARRRICDERRAGYALTYTVTGHTAQSTFGQRATWVPDTVVTVRDDILGISDNFYLEACEYKRDEGSGTTTTLHLNRTGDLIFGEPVAQ